MQNSDTAVIEVFRMEKWSGIGERGAGYVFITISEFPPFELRLSVSEPNPGSNGGPGCGHGVRSCIATSARELQIVMHN